jgi:glycogen synthase
MDHIAAFPNRVSSAHQIDSRTTMGPPDRGDLVGIVNGIDCDSWSPEDSACVPFRYNARDLSGKRHCKAALQSELGLDCDQEVPLIAYVSRIPEQKMAGCQSALNIDP